MKCSKCGKNLGKTLASDHAGGSVFVKTCTVCGFVNRRIYPGYTKTEECPICSGTGQLRSKQCPNCAGHGTVVS